MPLSTYDELKKAVIAQTHRGDLDLLFDQFLLLTEIDIRANPKTPLKMNLAEKVSTASASTTTEYLALPDGFQSSRKFSIALGNGTYKLTYQTPEQMFKRQDTGVPVFFTVRNNEIEFDIIPDQAYTVTLTHVAEVPELSATNQTNIILTKYPALYLWGCLRQAAIYSQDTEQAAINDGLFSEALVSANALEHNIKYPTQAQCFQEWAP